jgi:hypothetical protein
MKIVDSTPTQLQLYENSWLGMMGVTLFGLPFLGLGIAAILFMGEKATLRCWREIPPQATCQLTTTRLLETRVVELPGQLQGAEIDVSEVSDGDDTYRVVLHTDRETVPMTGIYTSGRRGHQQDADRIDAFVRDAAQTQLQVSQDSRWLVYGIGGLFAVVGGALTVGVLGWGDVWVRYSFDKTLGKLRVERQKLLRRAIENYRLKDIETVQLKEKRDSDGDRHYSVLLNLHSGNEIVLTNGGSTQRHRFEQLAEELAQFLELAH